MTTGTPLSIICILHHTDSDHKYLCLVMYLVPTCKCKIAKALGLPPTTDRIPSTFTLFASLSTSSWSVRSVKFEPPLLAKRWRRTLARSFSIVDFFSLQMSFRFGPAGSVAGYLEVSLLSLWTSTDKIYLQEPCSNHQVGGI